MVLQGWEMVHGNLLLRGWYLSDVSFYTFEVPVDGLVAAVDGLRTMWSTWPRPSSTRCLCCSPRCWRPARRGTGGSEVARA